MSFLIALFIHFLCFILFLTAHLLHFIIKFFGILLWTCNANKQKLNLTHFTFLHFHLHCGSTKKNAQVSVMDEETKYIGVGT